MKTLYISNTPKVLQSVPLGFSGLGNSPFSTPFKKVEAGTSSFKDLLDRHKYISKDDLIEASLSLLNDTTKHFPDEELTKRRQDTAELFSSIHVDLSSHGYGTRTRTVILVDNEDNIDYIEETMTTEDPNGEWERTHLRIPENEMNSTVIN